MKYHAKLLYGAEKTQTYSDWDRENIIKKLLIPFINGQVVYLKSRKTILNLNNVSELTLYRTAKPIKEMGLKVKDAGFDKYDCTEELINEVKTANSTDNSTSLLQKSFAIQKNQVFVVMKFGDKVLDSAYEGVIKPLFEDEKLSVIRVDEIQNSGKISDQILQHIAESKLIFSELTDERPNCYYETGFAHALGKEIILSIHKKSKIHFDLAGHRFIQWETESELRKLLKQRIRTLLKS
ncbi:MAG: hypothetical protein JNM91_00480 [Flavobacteriales bacterium]|nr:hypothetical protein [Flavobacteriales bacterium]